MRVGVGPGVGLIPCPDTQPANNRLPKIKATIASNALLLCILVDLLPPDA
jgi:hypothetical protein